jgi:hypothetical protein
MSSIPISCLVLGKFRHIAEGISSSLPTTDFSVAAILDEHSFSPANVGIVSRALVPRPKALIIGGGFSDEEAQAATKAWEEYVKEVGAEGTAVVRVSPGTLEKSGPTGVADYVLEELESKFK